MDGYKLLLEQERFCQRRLVKITCVSVCVTGLKDTKWTLPLHFSFFFFLCYFLSRSQKHMYGLNQDKVWVRTHSAEIRTDTLSASTNKHTNTHTSAFLQTQRNSQLLQKHTHTHTHQRLGQCSLSVLPPQMWRWKRRNAECCSHCCKENIPYSVILYM